MIGIAQAGDEEDILTRELHRTIRETLLKDYRDDKARLEAVRSVVRQTANKIFNKKPIVEVHFVQV